jgi:hypothetical protein
VKKVMPTTPIWMITLRLTWSEIAEAIKPPTTTNSVAAMVSQRIWSGVMCSGPLANTSSEPVSARSYPSIKPTSPSTRITATWKALNGMLSSFRPRIALADISAICVTFP